MEPQKTYRWYFILTIIYGLVNLGWYNLSFSLLDERFPIVGYSIFLPFFILSIVVLIKFIKDKMPRIYFVLPILVLIDYIAPAMYLLAVGFPLSNFMFLTLPAMLTWMKSGNDVFYYFAPSIVYLEIGFALYMLYRIAKTKTRLDTSANSSQN